MTDNGKTNGKTPALIYDAAREDLGAEWSRPRPDLNEVALPADFVLQSLAELEPLP